MALPLTFLWKKNIKSITPPTTLHCFVFRDYLGDFLGLVNINPVTIAAGPFCGIIKSPFAVTTRGFKDRRALLYFRTNNGLAFKGFNATYFALTDTSKISKLLLFYLLWTLFLVFWFRLVVLNQAGSYEFKRERKREREKRISEWYLYDKQERMI